MIRSAEFDRSDKKRRRCRKVVEETEEILKKEAAALKKTLTMPPSRFKNLVGIQLLRPCRSRAPE
jgi:hypothetical protein